MFKFSLKQLLRQKGRALLFFLLLAASTALVVTGSVMTSESTQRIATVESTYTTIGMVEQLPIDTEVGQYEDSCDGPQTYSDDVYGDIIMMDALDFPGADYIVKPEQRPVFVTYQPDMRYSWGRAIPRHLLELTPLENTDGTEPVEVKVTRVLHSELNGASMSRGDGSKDKKMEVGDIFILSQARSRTKVPLEVGEKYVCNAHLMGICQTHGQQEYGMYIQPHTNQCDTKGEKIDTALYGDDIYQRIHHVTGDDFYEPGHMGDIYEKWVKIHEMENSLFPVLGTSSLTELPSYHDKTMQVTKGREITPEEFAEGALVCMLPEKTATVNRLSVGDKIKLPLTCAIYGGDNTLYDDFPLLNAEGEFYDVFWEQEYEIVGLYTGEGTIRDTTEYNDISLDMFIIPINSVGASWDNIIAGWYPPSKLQTTFQIPNGTIQEFDEALRENVPEVANLQVTYDDRGYTEVMKSLNDSRDMAYLLLLGGILAALAIIALLLYFFVVKEKKRTAIERSLGMSKKQCRVSLLGGLAVLTAASVIVGTVLGTAALSLVREEPKSASVAAEPGPEELDAQYKFSTKFSLWAKGRELAEDAEIEAEAPVTVYLIAPLGLCLLIGLLAWLLLHCSFWTDPIYLLSTGETI